MLSAESRNAPASVLPFCKSVLMPGHEPGAKLSVTSRDSVPYKFPEAGFEAM